MVGGRPITFCRVGEKKIQANLSIMQIESKAIHNQTNNKLNKKKLKIKYFI